MDPQEHADLGALARAIIDSSLYMTLGTADGNGRPWVSPVYFAPEDYREFFWVSSPEAQHSLNLATRRDVAIVVFDSQVRIGTGQGVYMSAIAEGLTGADVDTGIAIFSRRAEAHGGSGWSAEDVRAPARHRLYRATASEHFMLDPHDRRTPVSL